MKKHKMKCYHGTVLEAAESIIKEDRFKQSKKPNEWLGFGVYFFAHYEEAEWWAKGKAKKLASTMAILEVQLEYQDNEFFDLDIYQNVIDVNQTFEEHMRELKAKGEVIPDFKDKAQERCFAIELYKRKHTGIKLMAYTFDAPVKYPRKFVFTPRQLQYCVIDQSIIKNITLMYPA